jgi:L-galactose dehydrogenase/L-glyceraldehyde 3-phosphate reductase
MKYRDFGSTGLKMSEVVFGGGFVGGIIIHADDDTRRRAIRRALDAGVNWIDTAPMYGQGKSEEALGWLLDEIDDEPILSTKVSLQTDNLDDIQGQVEASLEQSLSRLKRQSVDLLQLHNPIREAAGGGAVGVDDVLRKDGAGDALRRMQDQGLTKHIGLTALGESSAVRRVIASERFASAQVYYNMINPSAALPAGQRLPGHDYSGVIDACVAHGVAVMAIRIFAAGVLATDVRHGREIVIGDDSEIVDEEARAHAALAALGLTDSGVTPHGTRAQTALRYVLANNDISGAVFGLAELSHLEEIIAAAEMGPLPDDALAQLNS